MLWNAIEGTRIRSLARSGSNPVQVVAFSPRGDQLAVGEISGNPQDIVLIDPITGEIRSGLAGHSSGVNALAFSPDGQTLATAGGDRTIKFWNLKDGKERATLLKESAVFARFRSLLTASGLLTQETTSRSGSGICHASKLVVGRCPLKA